MGGKIRKHWKKTSESHKLKGYPSWKIENCQLKLHYHLLYHPLVQQ